MSLINISFSIVHTVIVNNMNLTNLPEKKLKRIENRRRKLSALVNIIKLNDQDRQQVTL